MKREKKELDQRVVFVGAVEDLERWKRAVKTSG
jgi:DNA-binding transcriptional regulator/RsmH inhibitor MraZ